MVSLYSGRSQDAPDVSGVASENGAWAEENAISLKAIYFDQNFPINDPSGAASRCLFARGRKLTTRTVQPITGPGVAALSRDFEPICFIVARSRPDKAGEQVLRWF